MKKHKLILATLCLVSFTSAQAATIIQESEATPSVLSEPGSRLIINEVNLKNSDSDWVEIYYSSPTGKTLNLNGISFQDDSVFKKIEQDFIIQPNQYILLSFASEQPDTKPFLYTGRTGLTGTTEQFIIRDRNNKILDAVCWTSATPTASEITDMKNLFDAKGWIAADITSCIPSELIKTGQSISRLEFADTNSAFDWEIAETVTPAAPNRPEEKEIEDEVSLEPDTNEEIDENSDEDSAETENTVPETDETEIEPTAGLPTYLPPALQPSTKSKTTQSSGKTAKKSSKKSSTPVYSDGDESLDIKISEIMANPKADDSKNEWIELYNFGEETVNLGNWKLDDDEKGSKPYILSDEFEIEPDSAFLIPISDSKISLANKSDKVRLFNFKDELMDEVEYSEAPEEQSYSLLTVTAEDQEEIQQREWVKEITPGEPNPAYFEQTGTISRPAEFSSVPYFFELTDAKGTVFKVTFSEAEIAGPLAKATFLPDTQIKIIGTKESDSFFLRKFEIISPGKQQEEAGFLFPSILGTIFTAGGSAFYFVRKKFRV